jgi:hypothetical protein
VFSSGEELCVLCEWHLSSVGPIVSPWPPLWSSCQEFLATDPEVPGSIPFRYQIFLEASTLSTQPYEDNRGATWIKVAASVQNTEINGRADPLRWPRDIPLPIKFDYNFSDKRRSLDWYLSVAD